MANYHTQKKCVSKSSKTGHVFHESSLLWNKLKVTEAQYEIVGHGLQVSVYQNCSHHKNVSWQNDHNYLHKSQLSATYR